jgi:hypothetical protein
MTTVMLFVSAVNNYHFPVSMQLKSQATIVNSEKILSYLFIKGFL